MFTDGASDMRNYTQELLIIGTFAVVITAMVTARCSDRAALEEPCKPCVPCCVDVGEGS